MPCLFRRTAVVDDVYGAEPMMPISGVRQNLAAGLKPILNNLQLRCGCIEAYRNAEVELAAAVPIRFELTGSGKCLTGHYDQCQESMVTCRKNLAAGFSEAFMMYYPLFLRLSFFCGRK